MRVLVTGADGFVGSWLVPHLAESGHAVVAAVRPGETSRDVLDRRERLDAAERVVELSLESDVSVAALVEEEYGAVVHLAAVASVSQAAKDVVRTWEVNTLGTVRLAEHLSRRPGNDKPVLLFVSTAEVYGPGPETPRLESDPTNPVSAYAASKLAAEIAVLEIHRRTGLPVMVSRGFGHTGPGQADGYVVPAFAKRLLLAKRVGAPVVEVGNLEPVREFLHVKDVVEAYRLLLEGGEPGQVYNVASETGVTLRDVFRRLADAAEHNAVPESDASLMRAMDLPYLVGSGAKIEAAVGWKPTIPWEQTLAEVIDAQAN